MLIRQKRIRNLARHIPDEERGKELRISLTDLEQHQNRLSRAGFTANLAAGDTILPAVIGPISRFNAEGKHIVRRDQEKETAYRQIEWHWTQMHGKDRVEMTGFRYVPYERYPRDFVPPPSVELQARLNTDGIPFVTSAAVLYDDSNAALLLHIVNLYLELFGEATILTADLEALLPVQIKRLNWQILPKGRHPWAQLQSTLKPIIDRAKGGNRGVISRRLETINEKQPDFVAVGQGGFSGYIVFGFPARNLFVLESTLYGNATYVFEDQWEALSQMSKGQILAGNLQKARVVHLEGWERKISTLLS